MSAVTKRAGVTESLCLAAISSKRPPRVLARARCCAGRVAAAADAPLPVGPPFEYVTSALLRSGTAFRA